MNKKEVNQLIEDTKKTACLLGMICGTLDIITNLIKDGFVNREEVYNRLINLQKEIMDSINDLYYQNQEPKEHE